MNNEIRELSMDELDLVSGGDIITKAGRGPLMRASSGWPFFLAALRAIRHLPLRRPIRSYFRAERCARGRAAKRIDI
jgi:hypothetical protein